MGSEHLRPSPYATERTLARCIRRAQRDGLQIICDAKVVPDVGEPRGVCAMGAYERLQRPPRLRLPKSTNALVRAWDAIESGFDANLRAEDEDERPLPKTWLAVGLNLRRRFQPMSARHLEMIIKAEEQAAEAEGYNDGE